MPTDHRGQTHAGTIGLFDDDHETAATNACAGRHELEDIDKVIRREERRARRRLRKEEKASQSETDGKASVSRPSSWLHRLFSSGKNSSSGFENTKLIDKASDDDEKKSGKMPICTATEWAVMRRPVTPDAVYTAQDVDSVDSPFVRECGMVRVKSDDAGGCHVVSKSSIQKSE